MDLAAHQNIDLTQWKRKEHYAFFSACDEPFFGITAEVECTALLAKCRDSSRSFFASYLFAVMKAANETEAFRYRIIDGVPVVFDEIHASAVLSRPDHSFAMSFIEYNHDFGVFCDALNRERQNVLSEAGLRFNDNAKRPDSIHFSTFPWKRITGLSHARNLKVGDSSPKVTIGSTYERQGKWFFSVSVHCHHALMDGYEVGLFLQRLEASLME